MTYTAYVSGIGRTTLDLERWVTLAKETGIYYTLTTRVFETEEQAEEFAAQFPKYTKPYVQKVTDITGTLGYQVAFFFSNTTKVTGDVNETALKRAKRIFK